MAVQGNDRLAIRDGLRSMDARAAFALVYTAIVLTLMEYFFLPQRWHESGWFSVSEPGNRDLFYAGMWVASTLVFFLLIPALIVRFAHREPLSSIGYSFAGARRHLPIYAGLFLVMVPVLLIVSRRPDFSAVYPFVHSARRDMSVFIRWELLYCAQFVALEAFFRGYLLFTCARRMGPTAIAVMVVPYTMIHFHKPFPECLGAAFAGLLLGALALRFQSFWGGVLLHSAVAVTMDCLAVRSTLW